EKVTRVAGALLYAYRHLAIQYDGIARAALKPSEIDVYTRRSVASYIKIADANGSDLQLSTDANGRVIFTATNKTTNQIGRKEILSPKEIGAQFIGALPEHFEKLIADLAGEELNEPDTTPTPSPPRARAKDSPKFSTGTGFFVTSEGHALTNAHVVEGCQTLSV